LNLEDS